MEYQTLILFVVASLSINLIPGPDVVYIVSNTMKGSMKMGLRAALGLGVGYLLHTLAAVVGLSALILNSALAFSIVKYLGAAYLLYLGVMALKNMATNKSALSVDEKALSQGDVFKQGMIVSILNPKVALFFLAFLPQFVDVAAGSTTMQLLTLGIVFSLTATVINMSYALLGSWLLSGAKSQGFARSVEGLSGVLLIGLAGKIALTQD